MEPIGGILIVLGGLILVLVAALVCFPKFRNGFFEFIGELLKHI